MTDRTNRIAGLAIAALLAVPMMARGGWAVLTQNLETTARLGPVSHLSGSAAMWMGGGIALLAVMILSVAVAQWDGLRTAARTSAAVSLCTGIACLGAALMAR